MYDPRFGFTIFFLKCIGDHTYDMSRIIFRGGKGRKKAQSRIKFKTPEQIWETFFFSILDNFGAEKNLFTFSGNYTISQGIERIIKREEDERKKRPSKEKSAKGINRGTQSPSGNLESRQMEQKGEIILYWRKL